MLCVETGRIPSDRPLDDTRRTSPERFDESPLNNVVDPSSGNEMEFLSPCLSSMACKVGKVDDDALTSSCGMAAYAGLSLS